MVVTAYGGWVDNCVRALLRYKCSEVVFSW